MTIPNSGKARLSPPDGRVLARRVELAVWVLAPDLFKLRIGRAGKLDQAGTDGVRAQWAPVELSRKESDGLLAFETSAAQLRVRIDDLAIALRRTDGASVLEAVRPDWLAVRGRELRLRFDLLPGTRCMGFGERTGTLDRSGRRLTNWSTDTRPDTIRSDPLYATIPFGLFLRAGQTFGLFVDHPGRSSFDLGTTDGDVWDIAVHGSAVDLYLFSGPDPATILDRYSELTGRPFLPPRWALGYHQSRWGYHSAAEVLAIAHQFRARRIPCDAIYLDIDYMDRKHVFTWDPTRFPDPRELTSALREANMRAVAIVDPGVARERTDPTYAAGLVDGHFCRTRRGAPYVGRVWPGPAVFPDFERDATRRWWGQRLTDTLLNAGVGGIWNDMNEPSNFVAPKTLPGNVRQGEADHERPHREVHNLYGLRMAAATYDALQAARPDERPFVVSRAGYAGIQRYAAVWLGDNRSSWDQLLASIPMALSMGLSGVPFVGADVGGWDDDCTPELLVRWTQLGAFLPFFRNHCALDRRPQEPWAFGPEAEHRCREAIALRYRFLPYLEQQFETAHRTGLPVARPVWLDFPDDEAGYDLVDQFLFGPDVLVAPAYLPGMRSRAVYLPRGQWVSFHDRATAHGGRWVMAEAPLDRIPLFIRHGARVPLLRHAAEYANWTESDIELERFS